MKKSARTEFNSENVFVVFLVVIYLYSWIPVALGLIFRLVRAPTAQRIETTPCAVACQKLAQDAQSAWQKSAERPGKPDPNVNVTFVVSPQPVSRLYHLELYFQLVAFPEVQ